MRIIARKVLRDFWEANGDSAQPLKAWFREAEKADWATPHDVKAAYRSASIIGDSRIVFNIAGNKIDNAEKGIWTWQNAEKGSIERNVIQSTKGGIELATYLENCTQKDIVLRGNTVKGKEFNIQLAKTNINVEVIS